MTKKDNQNVDDTIKIADNLGLLVSELVKLRVDKGFTQRELAEITGLKQSAIARLEKLNAIPRVDTIITIAHFLGYTLTLCNYQNKQVWVLFLEIKSYLFVEAYNLLRDKLNWFFGW